MQTPTMIDGSSRTSLAVTVAISLALFTIGGSVAVGKSQIADLEAKITAQEKDALDHDRRIQRIEDNYLHIVRSLERIDAKIDELTKRP